MSQGKRKCEPFDQSKMKYCWNEWQETVYEMYGKCNSAINETARRLDEIHGSESRRIIGSSVHKIVASIDKRARNDKYALIPELIKADHEYTEEELIEIVRQMKLADPERHITRAHFRQVTQIPDSSWNHIFGTFEEFVRQARFSLNRGQHRLEKHIAKHKSSDHYAEGNERQEWAGEYLKPRNSRITTNIVFSDTHDIMIDPFYRRVLVDTVRRIQPDRVIANGDIFDLAEFGKYTVDPRNWNVTERMRHAHGLFDDLREAAPNAEFWFLEGNHEFRLIRHLQDQSPALRAVLSDLHNMGTRELLGLDKYEINYVSKADLRADTKGAIREEVKKNYKLFDDCYLVGHYKMLGMGYEGTSGHEHKYQAWPVRRVQGGAVTWIQTGAGHLIDAEYCNAENIWNLGFLVTHIDTMQLSVCQNYVPITTIAEVGGVIYTREPHEFVGAYYKDSAA